MKNLEGDKDGVQSLHLFVFMTVMPLNMVSGKKPHLHPPSFFSFFPVFFLNLKKKKFMFINQPFYQYNLLLMCQIVLCLRVPSHVALCFHLLVELVPFGPFVT